MMFLSVLGDFTEAVLGLAFSFGCALLLAFVCLRFLLGLMTRQQYNVTDNDDPSHVRSILWLGATVGRSNPGPDGTSDDLASGATGGSYILPAAAPRSRFAGISKLDLVSSGRVVELPQLVSGRIAQVGCGDDGDAA